MDQDKATQIRNELGRAIDAGPEESWAIWGALVAFPSTPNSDLVWVPTDDPAAHWLDGQVLVSVTFAEGHVAITGRPIVGGTWGIDARFESMFINDAGLKRSALGSQWHFDLAEGKPFEICARTLIDRDGQYPENDEQFARAIAAAMIESTAPASQGGTV